MTYLNVAKRIILNAFASKRNDIINRMELVTNTMVIIILQFINVSNQHIYLTFIQCYMSFIFQ